LSDEYLAHLDFRLFFALQLSRHNYGETSMSAISMPITAITKPWRLPAQGLAVFEGEHHTAQLSQYFLPSLVREGKRILFLDGANSVNPRLMAKLAERRGISFQQFNQQVQIARAFTCFQLTELIARVPQFLSKSPAQILMVTALPELYFDEDVCDWDARVAFKQAMSHLAGWLRQSPSPLAIAVFSSALTFSPPESRKHFLAQARSIATELWRFTPGQDGKLQLTLHPHAAGSRDPNALVPPTARYLAR
jgi:hypothetical protein